MKKMKRKNWDLRKLLKKLNHILLQVNQVRINFILEEKLKKRKNLLRMKIEEKDGSETENNTTEVTEVTEGQSTELTEDGRFAKTESKLDRRKRKPQVRNYLKLSSRKGRKEKRGKWTENSKLEGEI